MTTKTLTVKLPVLHPSQRQIIRHPARFKVLACGRRFGKTTVVSDILINDMLNGYPVAYCAPSYKMVQEVWRVIKRATRFVAEYTNETEKRIDLVTGGTLDMWSLESPDSIRGRKYYRVAIDEAAYVKNLKTIWEKAISPLLTDYRGGALFPSTPQGYNDFFKLYQYGFNGAVENWWSFKFPTSANPYIPADEIELQRRTLPPRSFAQEYEASFEEDAGAVYDNFSDANITTDAEYNPELSVAWGVDDGYVYGEGPGSASYHPRVILFAHLLSGAIHVFDEYSATGELSEVSIANALERPYRAPEVAYIDSSAAELRGRLWNTGTGIQTFGATHKVLEGIKNVRRLVRDGQGVCLLKIHPRCVNLIRELQTYRYDINNHGTEPKPLKLDDHFVDALRYLCHVLRYE